MGFITSILTLGGNGFSVSVGDAVSTETGYPVILTQTLAKPLVGITVYGATGGVGDYDIETEAYTIPIVLEGQNLFDVETYPFTDNRYIHAGQGNANSQSNYKATLDLIPCQHLRNQTITLNKRPGGDNPGIAFYNSEKTYLTGFKNGGETANKPWTFTIPPNAVYMRFTVRKNADGIMLLRGTYTEETLPDYVEYISKTINVYSDAALGNGDSLVFDIAHESAARGGTDISDFQDWDQDMIPWEANEITVSASTTVAPSNLEIKYSKR